MSRDSSGNYSLPVGNPVVAGTTIEATWANTTMNDLATAATNSLDRTGKGAMQAPIKLADGSVSAPAAAFNNETNTGLYLSTAGELSVAIQGQDLLNLTQGRLELIDPSTGAAASPVLRSYRNKVSPSNNDVIGRMDFDGNDSTDTRTTYGQIEASIAAVTDAAEGGNLTFRTMQAGTVTDIALFDNAGLATFYGDVTVDGTFTLTAGTLDVDALTAVDLTVTGTVTIPDDSLTISDTSGLQAALDLKAPLASPTFTGTATAANLTVSGTIDFPNDSLAIADTAGLQGALDAKAPIASPTFTGTATIPTADINGGAIDGTAIGSTTPSAGNFTTLDSTGIATLLTLQSGDGTASLPSHTFESDPDSGMYRVSANTLGWSTGGAITMQLSSTGQLDCDGDVVAFSTAVSDARFKDNVHTIYNALDMVEQLRGVEYTWNTGSRKGMHEYGLIAQEVEQVMPSAVHEKESPFYDGPFKTVDYMRIIGVLVEGMKELSAKVEALENDAAG